MEQLWTPTDKLKKKMIMSVIGGELFVLLLLSVNFLQAYSVTTSLVLLFLIIGAIAVFDVYTWKRLSNSYILIDETGIEWTGVRAEWAYIEEVRVKKEKEKPKFLVIKEGIYYHKLPLHLYDGQIDVIFEQIRQTGMNIAE